MYLCRSEQSMQQKCPQLTSLRKNLPVPITKKNAHLSIWLLELIGILHPPFKAKETRNDGKRVRVNPPGFSPSFKAKF